MSQQEILELFRAKAKSLDPTYYRLDDILSLLANTIANAGDRLTPDNVDALIYIGGVLHKEGAKRSRARVEVAETMKASHDAYGQSQSE